MTLLQVTPFGRDPTYSIHISDRFLCSSWQNECLVSHLQIESRMILLQHRKIPNNPSFTTLKNLKKLMTFSLEHFLTCTHAAYFLDCPIIHLYSDGEQIFFFLLKMPFLAFQFVYNKHIVGPVFLLWPLKNNLL
jgi:hypothetical protein